MKSNKTNDPVKTNRADQRKRHVWLLVVLISGLVSFTLMRVLFYHHIKKVLTETPSIASAVADNLVDKGLGRLVNDQQQAFNTFQQNTQTSMKQMNALITTLQSQIQAQHKQQLLQSALMQSKQQTSSRRVETSTPKKPPLGIYRQRFSHPMVTRSHALSQFVTAGTYARAVLLSGADTDAGVEGQQNTTPVNLRFITNGILPNGHHSSLKGCLALASAYGSVSAERSQLRLTRLSCIRSGKILDIPAQGVVIDQSGMNGIRGHLVMRNAPMLRSAGISGFLSGVGKGMSSALTTQSVSPLGVTTALPSSEVFKYGAYTGANTALDKLADYYIKLAALYHPVIELHPGAIVDVLFLKGLSLNVDTTGSNQSTTSSRTAPIQTTHFSSNTDHTQAQLNALMRRMQVAPLGATVKEVTR